MVEHKCSYCGCMIEKSSKVCPYCEADVKNSKYEKSELSKQEKTKTYEKKAGIKKSYRKEITVTIILAITVLAIAFVLMPNAEKYYNEGVTLYNQKRYDEAIAKFDNALEIDPNYEKAKKLLCHSWCGKGDNLSEKGEYSEAITCYDKAIGIDPNDARAWNNKGVELSKLERSIEAQKCFDRAEQLEDKD